MVAKIGGDVIVRETVYGVEQKSHIIKNIL